MIPSHFDKIDKDVNELATLLGIGSTGVVICTYENIEEVQFVKKRLNEATKEEVDLYEYNYTSNREIVSELEKLLKTFRAKNLESFIRKRKTVLSLEGMEKVFETTGSAEKLNWFRDFFIRTDYLTLLWIEEKYLGVLAREVPDFWRLRTKIFNFHMRPELTKTVLVLSYNKSDKDFVLKLFPAISKDYDVIIWTYDETNAMPDNMQIKNVINESVKVFFIPVLSSNYLSTSYQAINEKLRKFIPHTNIGIVPILHENVEIPTELNAYKYIDFTQDFENGLYNLVIELDLSLKLKSNIKILHRQQLEELETAKANKETNLIKQVRKPLKFRTEKELLVGRVNYINEIQNFLIESKDPISIIGIGGIGKSTLAFKVMHKCEHIFDLIIPIYFESGLTFDDFLLELCKGLDLRIDQFEKLSFENRQQVLIDTLANYRQKVLIYLDNYENVVFGSLGMVHINDFLQSISSQYCHTFNK